MPGGVEGREEEGEISQTTIVSVCLKVFKLPDG